jgi:ketosteroid isomerase-like protein
MAQAGLLRGVAARVLPNLAAGPKVMTADPAQNGSVLEKVSAVFAAFDSGDAIGLLSQLHDDIAVDDVMLASASSCKSGTLDWLRTWAEAVSDRRTDVVRAIVVRDSVLVEIIAHGKLSGPIGALAPAERPFAVHRAAIIEFRDDQIGHITILTNGRDLAEQTAQWPPRTTRGVNATRLRDRVRERHVPVGIVLSGRGRLGREVPDSRLDRTVDRGGHAGPPFCFGGGLAK